MSDEQTNNETAPEAGESLPEEPTTNEAEAPEVKEEHTVPVSALQKEREKASSRINELEAKIAKINEQEEERKKAELSEIDRYKLEAEEAAAKASELENKLIIEERTRVALNAANKAGYADPEDALRFVDLVNLSSNDEIQEAVSDVLNSKAYLKAEAPKGPAVTSGVEDGQETTKAETPESAAGGVIQDALKFLPRR